MRRQGSTSNAILRGDATAPRRGCGQRHGRLFLTTALVGVGLALAPAAADEIRLVDGVAVTGATIDWNTQPANQVWRRTSGSPSPRAFANGDDVVLQDFAGVTDLTLNVTATVRPGVVRVRSSEYTITGPGTVREASGSTLTFLFEGTDRVLTMDAEMSGPVLIGRGAGPGSGGRLAYGGTATTGRVRVLDGTTLAVVGDLSATAGSTNGFRLGSDSTLEVATGGTATGSVERDTAGDTGTALVVEGTLAGDVTGIGTVTVSGDGSVTGTVTTGAGDTIALKDTGGSVTVGQVAGSGLVTIEGDVAASGIAGTGADIAPDGVLHAVNGGGTLTVTGALESEGILGSDAPADGVTAIDADTIRLTGGEVKAAVSLRGALEVGGLALTLDGNDEVRGTLNVNAGGLVTAASDAPFASGTVAVVIATNGSFTAATNLTNLASVQSAGGFRVNPSASVGTGALVLNGTSSTGNAVINGTLTSASAVQLNGGNLTVGGTLAGGLVATGGKLVLNGGTLAGAASLATDADLAGTADDIVLEAGAEGAFAVVTTGTLTADSLTQKGGTFTVAAPTTLNTGASAVGVEGGRLIVRGTAGDVSVTGAGVLELDGGTLGLVTNAGTATTLHGTIAALDNQAAGTATIDGALAVTGGLPTLDNLGTLIVANAGSLSGAGAAAVTNSGTLRLNGDASGSTITNGATLQVDGGGDGKAAAIANAATLDILAGGKLTVSGGVTSTGTATIAGELAGDIAGGTVTVANGGTVSGDVTSAGPITVQGTVTGTLTASGTATVAGTIGTLRGLAGGSVTMNDAVAGNDLAVGALVNDGAAMTLATNAVAVVSGSAANNSGTLTLRGTLDVTGAAGARLDNAATLDVRGTLAGGLGQSGGATTIAAGGTVTGLADVTGGTLAVNGTLGALTLGAGTAGVAASGAVTGAVLVTGGSLDSAGTLGSLTNNATATLAGTVTGALQGSGATTTTGNLSLGGGFALTGAGSLTVAAGHTVSLGAGATGTLQDNALLDLQNADLSGDVTLAGAGAGLRLGAGSGVTGDITATLGTVTVDGNGATLTGSLTNHATLAGAAGLASALTITGDLVNGGSVVTGAGGTLVVTVLGFREHVAGGSVGAGVTILGTTRNSGNWTIASNETVSGGDLLNADTGTISVAANLSLTGNNLFNDGTIGVAAGGSLTDVATLTNRTGATLTNAAGGLVAAGLVVNDGGTLTNDGTIQGAVRNDAGSLTSTGAIDGTLTNRATASLGGTIATLVNAAGGTVTVPLGRTLSVGTATNRGGATMTVRGLLSGSVTNEAGGTFVSTGTLAGIFRNEGTATLSGAADAVVNAGGSLGLGGNLMLASLTNEAALTVNAGRVLTLAGGALTNAAGGTATVVGTVAGDVENAGTLVLAATGTVSGLVTQAGGTTALRGTVTGLAGNLAGGTTEVTGPLAHVAALDNQGQLRVGSAGHLTATGLVSNGGTAQITGAVTAATLRNTGTLTSSGTLTAAVENAGSATVSGTINGSFTNATGTTVIGRDLALSGPMAVQGGTVQVKLGAVLNAPGGIGVTEPGRLSVTGSVLGDVTSTGTVVSLAGADFAGTLVNDGSAQLAGHVATLRGNAPGRIFVHGHLGVDDLASAGRLTVAAGKVLTVALGSASGETVVAGTLNGPLVNLGRTVLRGKADGLHNAAGGRLELVGGVLANGVNDGDMQVAQASTIGAGGLLNNGTLRLVAGARLSAATGLHNAATGEAVLAGTAQVRGPVVNDGLLVSTGTMAGTLTNNGTARLARTAGDVVNAGTLHTIGTLTVAGLTNSGTVRVTPGTVLRSEAELVTAAGGTTNVLGTLDARLRVEDGGQVVSTGRVQRALDVAGEARLAGRVADVAARAGSTVLVTGNLVAGAVSVAGATVVQAGVTLTPATLDTLGGGVLSVRGGAVVLADVGAAEGARTEIAGRVQGNIDNAGQLVGQGGSVSGDVFMRTTGTITGALNIEGRLIIAQPSPQRGFGVSTFEAEPIIVEAPGFVTFGDEFDDPIDTHSVIEAGSVVVLADGALIEPTGDLTVLGMLIAHATNEGALTIGVPGLVQGNVLTSGAFSLAGRVTGNVTFAGGSMSLAPTGTIGGDLVLAADHGFAGGEQVNAARLVVEAGTTMAATGGLTVNADLVNGGTLTLADGAVGDVVTVTGALSGDGVYRLDTDIGAGTADLIDVTGGPITGRLTFDINEIGSTTPDFGQAATLLRWDTATGGANSFELADPLNLPEATERVIYLIAADEAAGEIQLLSAANPAVGAISGNIVLTQSLIGTVVNRPSSPYTTGIGFEADKACRVGSWGRAVGGTADAGGATRGAVLPNGNRISVDSEISADYRGLQVGTDLGCYDGRFADWTIIGGAILGLNTGSTSQPVYAVDPLTGTATSKLTSVNDADFDQKYAGVYVSAMKGRWVLDLQLRREWTEFKLNNTPEPGSIGLRLTDARFDSRATTVSGSVGYSMPLGGADSGWSLTPTAGFSWTRTSTDTIVFDDDSTLELDDSQTRIGFVGAGVSRTKLAADGRSAFSLFASGTYYKDFADPVESTFTLMHSDGTQSVQRLSSDNLGSYGEISLGASYVRLLEGAGRVRQLNATIRVDGRSGGTLDSYGITGQLRLQF